MCLLFYLGLIHRINSFDIDLNSYTWGRPGILEHNTITVFVFISLVFLNVGFSLLVGITLEGLIDIDTIVWILPYWPIFMSTTTIYRMELITMACAISNPIRVGPPELPPPLPLKLLVFAMNFTHIQAKRQISINIYNAFYGFFFIGQPSFPENRLLAAILHFFF